MRGIPAINRLLEHSSVAPYEFLVGRDALRTLIGAELDRVRGEAQTPPLEAIAARVVDRVEAHLAQSLMPVINATGVLLHTNLGRAPLASSALASAREIGEGYSNLEYDLIAGERGSRYSRVTSLLCELTGAEDAIVVNNCAAAVLLILDTFARGAEVVVARNQLIEIGGGFRVPDVLARSGATLVEVGATNKVYLDDFAAALSPRTALFMRSHPSNYRIEGFVHDVDGAALAALARRAGVPVVEDLGSGALTDLATYGLPHERTVQEALADGIALVAFSGDKLLGGPQAGIIVGTRAHVARLRSNPLVRALRVDKVTLALLSGTLRLHRTAESRDEHIPFYRMLATPLNELRERAERYVREIPGGTVIESRAYVGGGSLPGATIDSIAVAFETPFADTLSERLRRSKPPIVGRIDDQRLVLDLRTVAPSQDAIVVHALAEFAT